MSKPFQWGWHCRKERGSVRYCSVGDKTGPCIICLAGDLFTEHHYELFPASCRGHLIERCEEKLHSDYLPPHSQTMIDALVWDIDEWRKDFSVDRWVICAGSSESLIALSYAQHHPHRVSALVLWSIPDLPNNLLSNLYRIREIPGTIVGNTPANRMLCSSWHGTSFIPVQIAGDESRELDNPKVFAAVQEGIRRHTQVQPRPGEANHPPSDHPFSAAA